MRHVPGARHTIASPGRVAESRDEQTAGITASCDTTARWWTISARSRVWGRSMQDGLYVPVIGPSAILPRGYLWLAPIWYLVIAAALAVSPWPPIWFRLTAAAGLPGAMIVFI